MSIPIKGVAVVEPGNRCGRGCPRVVGGKTWVQWTVEWDAIPGDHTIRVRATDGQGATQTDAVAAPAPDGATGWHSRRVTVNAS